MNINLDDILQAFISLLVLIMMVCVSVLLITIAWTFVIKIFN